MGALIIVMLWLGVNIAIEILGEDKKKRPAQKICRKRQKQVRIYDFDILSYDEPEYTSLKKSA